MGEHKIAREGKTPTLVEVRTFLIKRDHDIVAQFAKEAGVPLSKFLPTVIGIGILDMLRSVEQPEESSVTQVTEILDPSKKLTPAT